MPTKKKKEKYNQVQGFSRFDKGRYLQFYKDRGMGLEPIIEEVSDHLMKYILRDLIKFLKRIKMTPAATHQIIDEFLFKDKNQRMNFLKHYVAAGYQNKQN